MEYNSPAVSVAMLICAVFRSLSQLIINFTTGFWHWNVGLFWFWQHNEKFFIIFDDFYIFVDIMVKSI